MSGARLRSACAWAALAVLAIGCALRAIEQTSATELPHGLSSATLAMELARSPLEVVGVVGDASDRCGDRRHMARLQRLDYAFIAAYTVLFALVGAVLWLGGRPLLGGATAAMALAAAFCDVRENLSILRLLEDAASGGAWPRTWAIPKWGLVFGLAAVASSVFVEPKAPAARRWIGYTAAALGLAAGVLGLAGIAARTDAVLEAAAAWLSLQAIVAFVFFSTEHALRDGLLQALNRLASSRWLRWLANW